MPLFNNEFEGLYYPSYFYIHINTEKDITGLNNLENQLDTFIHEYIHFLQDITTTYGLTKISLFSRTQYAINESIRKSNTGTYTLPIEYLEENEDINDIDEMFSWTEGDSESSFDDVSIVNLIELFDTETDVLLPVIHFIRNSIKQSFLFGSKAILESMANILESLIFNKPINTTLFPYNAVYLLASHIYQPICKDPANLVFICDVALNTHNPGKFFLDLINRMKTENFVPLNYKQIYKYCEEYKFSNTQQSPINTFDLYKLSNLNARNDFNNYFGIDLFKPLQLWFDALLDDALTLRKHNWSFWVDILDKDSEISVIQRFVEKLINVYYYPLISNNRNQLQFYHPALNETNSELFIHIIGMFHLRVLIYNPGKSCGLKDYCLETYMNKGINFDNCSFPWNFFNSKPEWLCPVATMMKCWGISEIKPILASILKT
jgi:hypothetical protein